MTPYQAQRIRFGILAARHMLERFRFSPQQSEDLDGLDLAGWIVGDCGTQKAFDNEYAAAADRIRYREGTIGRDEMRSRHHDRTSRR